MLHFHVVLRVTQSIFSLVHSDIWGPSRVNFTLGFRYFVSFIDDYSRCTWVFLMTCHFELFLYSRVSLLKYKISLVFLFVLSVVIMPKNTYHPNFRNLCLTTKLFTKHLVHTLPSKMVSQKERIGIS